MNSDALNALDQVVAIARRRADGRVPVVGVAGPQGSGKTTLVKAYAAMHAGVAHFSLDDVYLDASLKRFATVFPACGSANSAIELNLHELETIARSKAWVDVCKVA